MKRITLLLCLSWPVLAGLAAEDLSIDWYTVDAGGGTSSAGEFTLSGTVGQPDAYALIPYCSACGFSILGGYWSQFSEVDQPYGPWLCIQLTSASTLLLSWRAYYQGYVLETRSAAAPSWNNVPATPVLVGAEYQVTLTFYPTDESTFFRLRKP